MCQILDPDLRAYILRVQMFVCNTHFWRLVSGGFVLDRIGSPDDSTLILVFTQGKGWIGLISS